MKTINSVSLIAAVLLLGTLFAGNVRAAGIEEKVTIIPGRTITSSDEATISSASLKVLRHIAQAREDIHGKELLKAQEQLKQAQTLIDIIKATEPTDKIKDRIWVAKKHLSYEDTETVRQDLIPIYASLDDIDEFIPSNNNAMDHINKAKKHLENANKKGATKELTLAEDAVVYTEIDLPLGDTERHVKAARTFLTKKESKKAAAALKSAEDGVQYLSLMDSSPVYKARKSFWNATQNYMAGRLEAAKSDIKDAKSYLAKVDASIDAKTKTEADKLLKDVESVERKVTKVDLETGQELNKLYERFKSLTLGTVDLFQAHAH